MYPLRWLQLVGLFTNIRVSILFSSFLIVEDFTEYGDIWDKMFPKL
jgi:hypothetical protein